MAFAAELESLAAMDTSFSFVATTTREPARRPGDFDRRIDMEMLSAVLASRGDRRELACFVCGATEFRGNGGDCTCQAGSTGGGGEDRAVRRRLIQPPAAPSV